MRERLVDVLGISSFKLWSTLFIFECNGDKKGLLYYLGTDHLFQPYRNPADSAVVTVNSSMPNKYSSPLNSFVGRIASNCWIDSSEICFISVDLKSIKIRLNYYTLQSAYWIKHMLRNWNLEGSNDALKWNVIKKHENDHSFSDAQQTCGWTVDCDEFYSMFRLLVTGPNSSYYWSISCAGIEFYG